MPGQSSLLRTLPLDPAPDVSHSSQIYGSMDVKKVTGNLHIVSVLPAFSFSARFAADARDPARQP